MKVGIVGLPNAGKSSLFNALTKAGAEAGNYPFTTVEPNVAIVPVRDDRLERVAETLGARPVVHETIAFHDIAGLVPGVGERTLEERMLDFVADRASRDGALEPSGEAPAPTRPAEQR